MMSRSLDLRERALVALASGMKHSQATEVFGVSRSTLYRWQQEQSQGHLVPRTSPGGPRKISPEQEPLLLAQLEQHPDSTLDEHLGLWQKEQGQSVSRSTMMRAIKRLNWTYKKRV